MLEEERLQVRDAIYKNIFSLIILIYVFIIFYYSSESSKDNIPNKESYVLWSRRWSDISLYTLGLILL